MWFSSWLRNWKHFGAGERGRAQTSPRKRATCRRWLEVLEDRTVPSTFTVANVGDSGAGSLRQAILDSNTQGGANVIQFAIGSGQQTIVVGSTTGQPLPAITDSITIDGTSQPGYQGKPLIELDGASAGTAADGLVLTAANSTVRGLVINRFSEYGIVLKTGSGDLIAGNYVGTDTGGTVAQGNGNVALGNANTGILVLSDGNTIGGTAPGAGNVISGNVGDGITLYGTSNTVLGNFIGVDATGNTALANGGGGVVLLAPGNTIGGTVAGAGNVISGNGSIGVYVYNATLGIATPAGTFIQGNTIGLGADGATPLGNSLAGIAVELDSRNVTIGGATAAARNVISDNVGFGIFCNDARATGLVVQANYVGTDRSGTLARGNTRIGIYVSSPGALIGGLTATPGTGPGNLVSANSQGGIVLVVSGAASGVVVEGNLVGTNASGTALNAFQASGVLIEASGVTVGGTANGAVNVISGNDDGVEIDGAQGGASGNVVEGNAIGTDITGTRAVPNVNGVVINGGASGNVIGGTAALRNLISGNSSDGIQITDLGTTGNTVAGNYIGTDFTGTLPLPNATGVEVASANNTVGGTADLSALQAGAARNIISGNTGDGVLLDSLAVDGASLASNATGNLVEGNYIGTNVTGSRPLSNGSAGVESQSAGNNIMGNVISGNAADGVLIDEAPDGTQTTAVDLNDIGTDATGTSAVPNAGNGIDVSSNLSISIFQNLISANGLDGVLLGSAATGNSIAANFIGTNLSGGSATDNSGGPLGNSANGIEVLGTGNFIGFAFGGVGLSDDDNGNVISGNILDGVLLGSTATGNSVQNNFIGTNATGTRGIGNAGDGLEILGSGNTVGGTTGTIGSGFGAAGNLISGNAVNGILIDAGAANNPVQGNYLGTDVTGKLALPNLGNGVEVAASNAILGGTTIGTRNLISGNLANGVALDVSATGAQVQGNFIGTDVTGKVALPNTGNGVEVAGKSNVIGGLMAGARNLISGNATAGILVDDSSSGTQLQGNYVGTDYTGTHALPNSTGVEIAGSGNTVGGTSGAARNLISGNSNGGVLLDSDATGNQIQGNDIGTDVTGTLRLPNGNGVEVDGNDNLIGGTTASARNVISGNSSAGILISGASGNLVQGNFIGTDYTGSKSVFNEFGVETTLGATGNTIGGSSQARNVISGNIDGLTLGADTSGNLVQSNYIGTDVSGTKSLPNDDGVDVYGTNSTIGGIIAGARNVISGNSHDGVYIRSGNQVLGNFIGIDVTGTIRLSNVTGIEVAGNNNTIGGITAGAQNVISGNSNDGILMSKGASGNLVQGNYVGIDITGTKALSNATGIEVDGNNNTVGSSQGGDGRNLISGNTDDGILLGSGTTGNLVQSNYIGTDANGSKALPNANGIEIAGNNNTIGGLSPQGSNLISGNATDGILLDRGTTGNLVQHNLIGTDTSITKALPNAYGVEVAGNDNTIGSFTAGEQNVISGNTNDGILLDNGVSGNVVANNIIGTDGSQTKALPNTNGVEIDGNFNRTLGNLISGNTNDGILLDDAVSGNLVQSNRIGTDGGLQQNLGNGANGVAIFGSNNTIGGPSSVNGNSIVFNKQTGVLVSGGIGNVLQVNTIFSNGPTQLGPGIVLTANGNDSLAKPALTKATFAAAKLTVTGTITGKASITYTVEFFANPPGSSPLTPATADQEGKVFLGSAFITTNTTGSGTISAVLTNLPPTYSSTNTPIITATMFAPNGDSSPFSLGVHDPVAASSGAPTAETWTGYSSTDWQVPANWSLGYVPDATNNVVVPTNTASGRYPVLDAATAVNNLTIQAGASLTLAGNALTVKGTFSNPGTLILQGNEAVHLTHGNDTHEGTWEYVGGSSPLITLADFGAIDYHNLVIADAHASPGTFRTGSALVVTGSFTITGGIYEANRNPTTVTGATTVEGGIYLAGSTVQTFNGGLSVLAGVFTGGSGVINAHGITLSGGTLTAPTTLDDSGNWLASGGTFQANQGTVVLTGTNQSITGSTTFFNLTKVVPATANDTVTFNAGDTETVTGKLTFSGASALHRLKLRSSVPGLAWNIKSTGSRLVSFVDVQDSDNIGGTVITVAGAHSSSVGSVSSASNIGWVFP